MLKSGSGSAKAYAKKTIKLQHYLESSQCINILQHYVKHGCLTANICLFLDYITYKRDKESRAHGRAAIAIKQTIIHKLLAVNNINTIEAVGIREFKFDNSHMDLILCYFQAALARQIFYS